MPLIYITGVAGTGKTTILEVLAKKGFETHDTDYGGITSWYNKKTGKKAIRPQQMAERTKAWYDKHAWKISRERIEALAQGAQDRPVFLCGSTLSDIEVWDLFDKVFCLVLDEETLKTRLATRTSSDWGKAPAELEHLLKWRKPWEELNRSRGTVMIDAARPIEDVIRDIIGCVNEDSRP